MTEFLIRGNNTTTAGFYSDTIIKNWADQAHKWAAGYHKWPFTEGRQETTFTFVTNSDGYLTTTYPEGWRSNTIRLLTIGGKQVKKTDFFKFQKFIEDNSAGTDRIYSDRGRQIYVNPNIDLTGTLVAWGQYVPVMDLTDLAATTVFSGNEEDGNQAIIEKMLAYSFTREKTGLAIQRGKLISQAIAHEQAATQILDQMWKVIEDERFGYQDSQNDGMFKRFDVLRGGFKEDLFRRDQFF